jgi:hypothetical protein
LCRFVTKRLTLTEFYGILTLSPNRQQTEGDEGMDQAKLRSLIYGHFRTAADMARQMGWGKQKLHRVITGKQDPNLLDLTDMARALGKPLMEMVDIFLPQKSPNGQLLGRA